VRLLRVSLIGLVLVGCAPSPVRVGAGPRPVETEADAGLLEIPRPISTAPTAPASTVPASTVPPQPSVPRPFVMVSPTVVPELSIAPSSARPTNPIPAPTVSVRPPAPAPVLVSSPPASRQSPSATPTDALTWARYSSASGSTIYLPSTWKPLEPSIYESTSITFAGSPESPSLPLDDHLVIVTLRVLQGTVPFTTAAALADGLQKTVFAGVDVVRAEGTHPAGSVVFLRYVEQVGSRPPAQETDAVFVVGGKGVILGSRASVDRWAQNAPVFRQIFDRFRPV
jgi:hypothetical protein